MAEHDSTDDHSTIGHDGPSESGELADPPLLLAVLANVDEDADEDHDGTFEEGPESISDSDHDHDYDHDSDLGSMGDEAIFCPPELLTLAYDIDDYPIDLGDDELYDYDEYPDWWVPRHSCRCGRGDPFCEPCGSYPEEDQGEYELTERKLRDDEMREQYGVDDCESICGEEDTSFPWFSKLPPELRCVIWEMYCPELGVPVRLLDFEFAPKPEGPGPQDSAPNYVPFPGPSLGSSTRRIRKLLAVHRESRALVMRALPDSLTFSYPADHFAHRVGCGNQKLGTGTVRFHAERDVVMLDKMPTWEEHWLDQPARMPLLDEFTGSVRNAAFFVGSNLAPRRAQDVRMTLRQFPQLKDVYHASMFDLVGCFTSDMSWMTEPFSQERIVHAPRGSYPSFELYCWPDGHEAPDFRTPRRLCKYVRRFKPLAAEEGWRLLPMIYFPGVGTLYEHQALTEQVRLKKCMQQTLGDDQVSVMHGEEQSDDNSDGSDSDAGFGDFGRAYLGRSPDDYLFVGGDF